jgi:hypothetical protein
LNLALVKVVPVFYNDNKLAMAKKFSSPDNGDIEFECIDEDGNVKKLYAKTSVLRNRGPKFLDSNFPKLHTLISRIGLGNDSR